MEKREARVYYIPEREGQKAIIIFDGGYAYGDIHIYEYVKSHDTEEIEKEIKEHYKVDKLSETISKEMVSIWVEKNFGHSMWWKLIIE